MQGGRGPWVSQRETPNTSQDLVPISKYFDGYDRCKRLARECRVEQGAFLLVYIGFFCFLQLEVKETIYMSSRFAGGNQALLIQVVISFDPRHILEFLPQDRSHMLIK